MDCSTVRLFIATFVLLEFTFAHRAPILMEESPISVEMPLNDETDLTCRMNIAPDKFQWRHYPIGLDQVYNPNYHLVLADSHYRDLPPTMYKGDNSSTTLTIKTKDYHVAGDYQCLAFYGAEVVASVPGRITFADIKEFPNKPSVEVTVTVGNTVLWACDTPISNPPALIDYYKNGKHLEDSSKSLLIESVTLKDSGVYKCQAWNPIKQLYVNSTSVLKVNVVSHGPNEAPKFIVPPKDKYTARKGLQVFLECAAVGTPIPKVAWHKLNGKLPEYYITTGGLLIENMTSSDAGFYTCTFSNFVGTITHKIELVYNEAPKVLKGPFIKNHKTDSIQEGEDVDLQCTVSGMPKPTVSWFLNGRSVRNDSSIDLFGNDLYFRPLQKRHAGMIQCFASNLLGTDYGILGIEVIPKQISGFDSNDFKPIVPIHKRKKKKLKDNNRHKGTAEIIPPSKPNVTRHNDVSVVVRWNVPPNMGLPIKFFKVQYRDMGNTADGRSSKWVTSNVDIPPNIRSFEVPGLTTDHSYKFRIAAVYSNDDNKLSPKSDLFQLNRLDFSERNPLPVPTITSTETVNTTSIKIFWTYTPSPNISIDGFFVNYMSASNAGDFHKATVDGENVTSFVITDLEPGTFYDIKMQSFTSKSASEFSQLMHQKTAAVVVETTTVLSTRKADTQLASSSNFILYIGAGAMCAITILIAIFMSIFCAKWKKKKNENSGGTSIGDKAAVEDLNHHIQVEGNDYVVSSKNHNRSNGCVRTPTHITIRSNPLADADNKNQNMIEMSCMSSQNNNCSTQPSVSTQEPSTNETDIIKNKCHKKDSTPKENYV